MNLGAQIAKSGILYFLHADTLPPISFAQDIQQALLKGFDLGCYRSTYPAKNVPLLQINAYFTRFDQHWCRGGDQSLFIKKEVFEYCKGFRKDFIIMEDFDFIERARKKHSFIIMSKDILISTRKYEQNGYLKVQLANFIVFSMYRLGFSQKKLFQTYRRILKWHY